MKISHKARRGRKKKPVPHKQHRKGGATQDAMVSARRRAFRARKAAIVETAVLPSATLSEEGNHTTVGGRDDEKGPSSWIDGELRVRFPRIG